MRTFFFILILAFLPQTLLAQKTAWDTAYLHINDIIAQARYQEALDLSFRNYALAEKLFGNTHRNYYENAFQIGFIYFRQKEFEKTITHLTHALETFDNQALNDSFMYGRLANLLGLAYKSRKNRAQTEKYYLLAIANLEKVKAKNQSTYSSTANNLAVFYREIGKTDAGIEYATKALENTPIKSKDYTIRLNLLGLLYKQKGQFKKALSLNIEALQKTDTAELNYTALLISLAFLYGDMGLTDKALPLALEAKEIIKRKQGEKSNEYANCLNCLAILNTQSAKLAQAIDYGTQACEITSSAKLSTNFYQYQIELAYTYLKNKELDKALLLTLEAKDSLEKLQSNRTEQYIFVLRNLSKIYQEKGDYSKALVYNEEHRSLIKELWSDKDENYISSLMSLVTLYNQNAKPDSATSCLKELSATMNNYFIHNQDVLDEYSKEIFTNTFIKDYEPLLLSHIYNTQNKDLIHSAYQAELIIKGGILNSSQLLRSLLKQQSDSTILAKGKEWASLKRNLGKAYSENRSKFQIDSLKKALSLCEDNLIHLIPALQNISQSVSYQAIQKNLPPQTALLEFVAFRYHNAQKWTDSIVYGVLIVKSGAVDPQFVPLFEEKQLKNLLQTIKPEELYSSRGKSRGQKMNTDDVKLLPSYELYNLVWKPLESSLKNIKNIYYAPGGMLHRLSFTALPINDTTLLFDFYQLEAVSSTRQALLPPDTEGGVLKTALMFGGILYDADSTALANTLTPFNYPKDNLADLATTQLKKRNNLTNSWSYLSGTKEEVDNIGKLFHKKGVLFDIKKGFSASEESFKSIGTEGGTLTPSVLHIATHGFFFPASQTNSKGSVFQMSDNPMMRSGLVMAGANRFWQHNKPYSGIEDGILSAFDIANMNLSGTKLVVLSACETGLGDIQGTEGVYGLQRAFKMAGADYILMSLWEVPDKQTAELMEKFYTFWLDGIPMTMAFAQAQQAMKLKYEPYFWAGFVLLH
jgi:CHAT domain-containing protein/lipopolysaccharide biosynthesis regulator YciM